MTKVIKNFIILSSTPFTGATIFCAVLLNFLNLVSNLLSSFALASFSFFFLLYFSSASLSFWSDLTVAIRSSRFFSRSSLSGSIDFNFSERLLSLLLKIFLREVIFLELFKERLSTMSMPFKIVPILFFPNEKLSAEINFLLRFNGFFLVSSEGIRLLLL